MSRKEPGLSSYAISFEDDYALLECSDTINIIQSIKGQGPAIIVALNYQECY